METCQQLEQDNALVFFLNGRKIVEPYPDTRVNLLHYLRQKLHQTGTKEGCGQGACGACTVMLSQWDQTSSTVRHVSANACLVPLCSLYGVAVTTVEGVGSVQNGLHPIQKSLVDSGGMQCGFCTPGMVMSMYALLRNKAQPTPDDIQQAIGGNLCRCTGYRPILDAFNSVVSGCPLGENCCQNQGAQEASEKQTEADGKSEKEVCQTQDPIFPPELQLSSAYSSTRAVFRGESGVWIRPVTLTDLLDLKAEHPSAPVVMGNTNAGYRMKIGQLTSDVVIQGTHVPELRATEMSAVGLAVGAAVTLTELDNILTDAISKTNENQAQHFCALKKMISEFGSLQIRNVATVGGNIMSAETNGDLSPVLIVTGAILHIASKTTKKDVTMTTEFFCGSWKTSLQAEEVLMSITIPYSKKNEFTVGFKQCQRIGFDRSVVNAGMFVRFHDDNQSVDELRLCYGGMGPNVVRPDGACEKAVGRSWSEELVEAVCSQLLRDLSLPPDSRGGLVKYKMALACSLFYKFYLGVAAHLQTEPVMDISATNPLCEGPCGSSRVFQAVDPSQIEADPVGRSVPHLSSQQISTGQAMFIDDWPRAEDELFLAFVRSKRAHAKILSVDNSEALTIPGVVEYIDHRDVQGSNLWGMYSPNHEVFASEKVTSYGQVIGGVLAESRDIARRATQKVKVEYEDLKPILTIKQAIEAKSFHFDPLELHYGDVEAGLQASDHVTEGELSIGGQEHFYLETQSVLVTPKLENDEIELLASSQDLTFLQGEISKIIGVSKNRIVCRTKRNGGGFGGKQTCPLLVCGPAAVAAKKTGKKVRCVFNREEDITITGKRHQMLAKYKVGFMSSGKILALKLDLYANGGYSPDETDSVLTCSILNAVNVYKIPNVHLRGHGCFTNIPARGGLRGYGAPQAIFIIENIMTELAIHTGLEQEQIREMNFQQEGDVNHWNQTLENVNIQKCWDTCVEQSQFQSRKMSVEDFNRKNRWKKRGTAMIPVSFAIGSFPRFLAQAGALVSIYVDGSVLVSHGGVELGQGLHTKMTQVAARALSVPIEKILISETSTDKVPNTTCTCSSAASDYNGMAILNACKVLSSRLQPYKDADPTGHWEKWVESAYMDCVSLSATGFYKGRDDDYDISKNSGKGMDYFSYGAICAEVEIDNLTGEHQVLQVDIVMDVGRSLNPYIDIGQIEGGFVQGYGLMTMEQLKMTTEGQPLNFGPSTYRIPTVRNIPHKFNVTLLKDCPNEKAIYSSKGIGEPPLLLSVAVFLAIKSAIRAVRRDAGLGDHFRLDCPATVESIRLACQDRFTKLLDVDDQPDPAFHVC